MYVIGRILAKHSGHDRVVSGEVVAVDIGFAKISDLYLQTIYFFREMGNEEIRDRDRAAFAPDHYAPSPTIKASHDHREMRLFRQEQGLIYHFDINAGICHQVMFEAGLVCPGVILVTIDSHTTTYDTFGCLGTGIGAMDMATVLMAGELRLRVSEIIRIRLKGMSGSHVLPKDMILYIIGKMEADRTVYKTIEFTDSYMEQLDMAGRMVLCNMAVEVGAKTVYMGPNQAVLNYVASRTSCPFTAEQMNDDFGHEETYIFDVSGLKPQVSMLSSVDNVSTVALVDRVRIDQTFAGACIDGHVGDIGEAARILRGCTIASHVRMVVIPASAEVLEERIAKGLLDTLIDTGATASAPGCGSRFSAHQGILATGEVCITTPNRNFPGRMGSKDSAVYLVSPATMTISTLVGCLTNPPQENQGQAERREAKATGKGE